MGNVNRLSWKNLYFCICLTLKKVNTKVNKNGEKQKETEEYKRDDDLLFRRLAIERFVVQFVREVREMDPRIGADKLWRMYQTRFSEEYRVGRDNEKGWRKPVVLCTIAIVKLLPFFVLTLSRGWVEGVSKLETIHLEAALQRTVNLKREWQRWV